MGKLHKRNILQQQIKGSLHTFYMAALIPVRGINTRSHDTVTHRCTAAQGRVGIGTIVGIDVQGIVYISTVCRLLGPLESMTQMETMVSSQLRSSPTQPMSTLMISARSAGRSAAPPWPTSS